MTVLGEEDDELARLEGEVLLGEAIVEGDVALGVAGQLGQVLAGRVAVGLGAVEGIWMSSMTSWVSSLASSFFLPFRKLKLTKRSLPFSSTFPSACADKSFSFR